MKIPIQVCPVVFTRSLLALGFAGALVGLSAGTVSAQDSNSTTTRTTAKVDPALSANERPKLTPDEQQFIKEAAGGNRAEVQLAKLALTNAESQGVKDFAQAMIRDHGKGNGELRELAKRNNIADFKPMVTPKDQETYKMMTALKGKAFDEAYVKNAVEDHKKDLADYREAHNKVVSKEVLDYLKTMEPIINEHLAMAQKLEKGEAKL